jgi:hypothetical protein
MTRLATAFIVATLALTTPADAYDVGDVVKFTRPTVGCHQQSDTVAAMQQEERTGLRGGIEYAFKVQRTAKPGSSCDVLAATSSSEYRIVEMGHTTASGGVLICVQPQDVTTKDPCMWAHMRP